MATSQFLENFLQALTAGLLTGAIYGLMCVGLSVIFGVMRVINFAHGDFMMLGMYVAYYAFALLGLQALFGPAAAPYVAALLAGPVIFLAGVVVHKFLVSRVTGMRGSALAAEGHYAQLILTLGVALILQNGGLYLFGPIGFIVGPIVCGLFLTVLDIYGATFKDILPPVRSLSTGEIKTPKPVLGEE